MEIQQRGNKTLAAYVHQFKMEAKRCDFNSDTAAICIFVKGLLDAHNITAKIHEKDPKTLSEVIKLVEKFNMTQQVTTLLTSPTVNMILNDDSCFVCGKIGHIGCHCPDEQCYNFEDFAQECPDKIPPSGTTLSA